uniref:Uncharacterized protein n=1 Tax=Arundo donax TaxID=35708 RepID=A0A0A9H1Y5_ARUDO
MAVCISHCRGRGFIPSTAMIKIKQQNSDWESWLTESRANSYTQTNDNCLTARVIT